VGKEHGRSSDYDDPLETRRLEAVTYVLDEDEKGERERQTWCGTKGLVY
jgi:hypothetical protein